MRNMKALLAFAVLTLGAAAGGCESAPSDVRYEYPAEDEDRIRPGSSIPQLGTEEE